jgi:hypothetical protein
MVVGEELPVVAARGNPSRPLRRHSYLRYLNAKKRLGAGCHVAALDCWPSDALDQPERHYPFPTKSLLRVPHFTTIATPSDLWHSSSRSPFCLGAQSARVSQRAGSSAIARKRVNFDLFTGELAVL